MIIIRSTLIVGLIICSVQGYFPRPKNYETPKIPTITADHGDPLFLTPYIKDGKIEEGRKLSRVSMTDEINIASYSGYFTVNDMYDSNMFFWYFPAMSEDKTAPVVVWLQGGPGSSSMFGLLSENGPLKLVEGQLGGFERRDIHWALNHHMIFIDNPVGTGFSFTNDSKGYCTDEVQVGEQLHNMVTQFFQLFPDLQSHDFFISGESYAGKYVPALGYAIHKKNPTADVKINLKGLAIGDGLTDPINMMVYDEYLFEIGLVDWNEAESIKKIQNKIVQYIKNKQFDEAADTVFNIYGYVTTNIYNYLLQYDYDATLLNQVMNDPLVQKSLHVGKRQYEDQSDDVRMYLKSDMMKSVAPWLSELLDHYRVLTYNGQLDIIVAYPLTISYLRKLNFTGAKEYETAQRHEWLVGQDLAGLVKQAGNLTEVLVRDAGHMVPMDQPKWAHDLITRFTRNQPFYEEE